MSKVNSVKTLRAKRAKRLAQKRGLPPIKGSSYLRPWRTTEGVVASVLVRLNGKGLNSRNDINIVFVKF